MGEKIANAKQTGSKIFRNTEDLLNAIALSATVAFSGYQAYLRRTNGILWDLLAIAAAWSVVQAFIAWSKVLNK